MNNKINNKRRKTSHNRSKRRQNKLKYSNSDLDMFSPIKGTVEIQRNGHGYLIADSFEENKDSDIEKPFLNGEDLFIHKNNLNTAMNKDIVTVKVIMDDSDKGNGFQGVVTEIVNRNVTRFSGEINIDSANGYGFVRTADKDKVNTDIFIPERNLNGATHKDIVVVDFQKWELNEKSPTGLVREVLGKRGAHEAEMKIILNDNNICYDFPLEVEAEAKAIPTEISEKEINSRKDMRNVFSFSIDGEDAKDLDDVLSFQLLENGNYEVGVHIADVTHYVKRDSLIDKEAQERGTSIYLIDRCIAMLPEKLSNGVCSLHPGSDKLCFSFIFEINKTNLKVKNYKFKKTIIHSNRRYSYDEVQKILEENLDFKSISSFDYNNEEEVKNSILQINQISRQLRKEKFDKGAVTFKRKEIKIELDEQNKPNKVTWYENKESNQLIEEWMLLANKTVATFLYKNEIPAAFRNHDLPNYEKLLELSNFVKSFGYEFNISDNSRKNKENLNKLLIEIKGKPEELIISSLAIRSMAKAECGTINIGHYGLGEKFMPPNAYAWITSPIRRYADICNHRQLFDFLSKTGKV